MAKNKSYNKIIAGTMTAAMVAGVVTPAAAAGKSFPDVPADHWAADSINYLVDKGAIKGKPDGTFGPTENIDRASAAVIMASTLGLEVNKDAKPSFEDAKNHWAAPYIAAVEKAGVIIGDGKGSFNPNDQITRAAMASMLVNSYKLEAANAETKFDDLKGHWGEKYANILVALEISKGTDNGWAPDKAVSRAEAAQFVAKTDAEYGVKAEAKVESVNAVSEKTLEVKGTDLKGLKAAAITLKDNEVTNVSASADGKTATVTFKNGFPLDKEQTVKVGDKEFKFTYSFTVKSVALDEKTYDDDTEGQSLTFKINGLSTTADADYLRQAGYSVNFVAVDSDNKAADIFEGGRNTSSTGLLAKQVPAGDYTVEVQVVKDGTVVLSDKKVIKVTDLESTTTAVKTVELTNGAGFIQNSTTLVAGETANITKLVGDAAGKQDVELPVAKAEVTSSNPAVVSVNNQTLTANGVGNATITIKLGNVTKTVNLTVTNAERSVAKVIPAETSVKVVKGQTRTLQVKTVDQYGDPIAVAAADIKEDLPQDASNNPLVSVASDAGQLVTTPQKGETATGFAIKGDNKGNGTVLFKTANDKVVGQITVDVTEVDNVASTKVEYTPASAGTTNEFKTGAANAREYQVSKLNKEGAYNGAETLSATPAPGKLTVEAADAKIAKVTVDATTGTTFKVEGLKAGKTDIVIKDENGIVKHKFTVSISDSATVITKVNFKNNAAVDYVGKAVTVKDVLDVRDDAGKDAIVYGVEHNASTIEKVRLDKTNVAELKLYIDEDADGHFNAAKDKDLGVVTAEVLSGAKGALAAGPVTDIEAGSYTTASGDKGTILFRVLVESNGQPGYQPSEAVATTVLNVNVK